MFFFSTSAIAGCFSGGGDKVEDEHEYRKINCGGRGMAGVNFRLV